MTHSRVANVAIFLTLWLVLGSCKKETEIQIKEVDKQYSWLEAPGLLGLQRVILSTGSNGQAIFLQQPNFFTRLVNQNPARGMLSYVGLPANINVRWPLGAQFFAYPANDSLLGIANNDAPFNNKTYVPLRRIDPTAIRFSTHLSSLSKCMVINKNNYLLVPYDNNRPDQPVTLLLAAVIPRPVGSVITAAFQRIVIPIAPTTGSGVYVRNLSAIDDYFLADLGDAGIYKIKQDGTFRQVYSYAIVDAFYKQNNTVYAPVEYNKILVSNDNGDSWQLSVGTPDYFTLASYYPVRDSLVGVSGNALYTVRWNGSHFTTRFLKNDGLERATITGVEFLHDTVYVATLSGLFVRPVKLFFDTKQ